MNGEGMVHDAQPEPRRFAAESEGFDGSPPAPRRARPRFGCAIALLALALAAAGHWAFWYRARPHALEPSSSRLLDAGPPLPVRLWIPYPHQNLGALGGAVGEPQKVLASAARLAGLPPPAIPRLGPFGMPASRELVVAASADGKTVFAAIRLYPVAAALTRVAGVLGRNPWLAGGEVELGGRPAEVRWDGLTWRLSSGIVALAGELSEPGGERDSAPALAIVELGEPSPPLPAARYTLRNEGGDLVARLGAPLAAPPLPQAPPERVILLWLERKADRSEALLLMEGAREGLLASLPAAAAWARPDGAMKVLPGGSLLRQLAGVRPESFRGGELAATERAAAARAEELAPTWLPLAEGSSAPPLALGGLLAIEPAASQAESLHQLLEEIPILGAAEAQRWGDVAIVLRAAGRYRTLSCWLAADGRSGELRLSR